MEEFPRMRRSRADFDFGQPGCYFLGRSPHLSDELFYPAEIVRLLRGALGSAAAAAAPGYMWIAGGDIKVLTVQPQS